MPGHLSWFSGSFVSKNLKIWDLERLYGEEFEREYYRLVTAGKFCGRVSIKSLMFSIVNCAVKAGSPFILLKEACNAHFWRDLQGEAMNAA